MSYAKLQQIIAAFEREFERELTLTEKVALASNTLACVRRHWRDECGTEPTF